MGEMMMNPVALWTVILFLIAVIIVMVLMASSYIRDQLEDDSGAARIMAERDRQLMEHGYTQSRDTMYVFHELALAAVCYALPGRYRQPDANGTPELWPWASVHWQSRDRIRDLEKAGALIAAEIDRLVFEKELEAARMQSGIRLDPVPPLQPIKPAA